MEAESPVAGDHPAAINSRGRVALRWWSWGVVSAPPTVVLHEFGHFIVLWGLGLPGAALHYASANHSRSGAFTDAVLEGDFAAAAEIAPMWGAVMSVAMGLVATYVVVFACCCYLCARWRGAPPPGRRSGIFSNIRISAALLVLVLPLFGRTSVNAGCDECWLERITGVPLAVWALPGSGFPGVGRHLVALEVLPAGDTGGSVVTAVALGYGVRGGGRGAYSWGRCSFRRSRAPTYRRFGGVP